MWSFFNTECIGGTVREGDKCVWKHKHQQCWKSMFSPIFCSKGKRVLAPSQAKTAKLTSNMPLLIVMKVNAHSSAIPAITNLAILVSSPKLAKIQIVHLSKMVT